ncbi:MAG: dephospho-CoA kinase [Legionella sp.]
MVYCVGLTGNIASGKSCVSAVFATFGITVINADNIARTLSAQHGLAYAAIIEHFGRDILLHDQSIDRKKLRTIIFSDAKERLWLEGLLHPLIRQQIEQEIAQCSSTYCMIEIPLLLDKTHYPYLNKILVVIAPVEEQITRVMARDKCTRQQALAVLATQPDNELRIKQADDLIINDAGFDELKSKAAMLHRHYMNQALNR